MPGFPWYCPSRGRPPFNWKGFAFLVVITSKQGVMAGVGDGYTVVAREDEEIQPVIWFVPVT